MACFTIDGCRCKPSQWQRCGHCRCHRIRSLGHRAKLERTAGCSIDPCEHRVVPATPNVNGIIDCRTRKNQVDTNHDGPLAALSAKTSFAITSLEETGAIKVLGGNDVTVDPHIVCDRVGIADGAADWAGKGSVIDHLIELARE